MRDTPLRVAQAKHTVPTGFPGTPPPGPAIPLIASDRSAALCVSTPFAISSTVASLTAPAVSRVAAETPSISRLAALL
jgi:SHS family lactate transporter-like MFS transporter